MYDDSFPYATLLSAYPESFHQQHPVQCYPAGHASVGFALMSLFFLFRQRRHRVIGGYKMLTGDHFLSHTVMTLFLAVLISLLLARLLLPTTVDAWKV